MLDLVIDAFIDTVKLLPFLFITFLIIELLEHKYSKKLEQITSKSGKIGPALGSFLGIFPQCGFSVVATNLYVVGVISLGTLISIYLSTSDEMLPILISRGLSWKLIVSVLLVKLIVAIICGFLIDLISRCRRRRDNISEALGNICSLEHCHCERSVWKSSLKHTINIGLFIFVVTICLNLVFDYIGIDELSKVFSGNNFLAIIISGLLGLIPNCGASVVITELYLNKVISFAPFITGLFTGSGVAILVLFRTNHNFKDSLKVVMLLYIVSVISGFLIDMLVSLL